MKQNSGIRDCIQGCGYFSACARWMFVVIICFNSLTLFILLQTRLFVTNQIQYLKHVDEVIVMDNNQISERGTFNELLKRNGAFAEFLRTHLQEVPPDDEEGRETPSRDTRQ